MFEKGEYIVYGTTGICQVADVTTMNMDGIPSDRLYYVLRPYQQTRSEIYTPVDNQKTVMRRVISREDALELIDSIPGIERMGIVSEKLREEQYKSALRSCDCREWVRMIKTLYARRKERLAAGKKIPAVDERYFRMASDHLFTELSIPLQVQPKEVDGYIRSRLEAAATA